MEFKPDAAAIKMYRKQMLEMYQQSSPAVIDEDNWLDNRYPEPNLERDKAAITPLPSESTPISSDFVGYLRVFAFTGGGGEPISAARVIVTRTDGEQQTVFANLTTNIDGFTPVIALPTVDPALTLQPGIAQPYVAYTVRVTADGFQPVEHRNIPVYGENYVTQPVAMTPILPGRDAEATQEFTSGGPANL